MAYVLNRSMTFEALRWYVVRVIAALEASGFADLAAPWRSQLEAVTAAAAALMADEQLEAGTTARVRVCDIAWDESVGGLSKKALYLAGGNAKAAPFAQLFGTTKATDLKRLGPAKATVAAGELLSKVAAIGEPELAASAQDLAAKTEALAAAEKADAEAELKLAAHTIARTKLLRQVESLIAETEAKLLTLRPGSDEMVRAILSPTEGRRAPRKDQPSDTPVPPPEG